MTNGYHKPKPPADQKPEISGGGPPKSKGEKAKGKVRRPSPQAKH